mgnify:FL=1
MSSTVAMSSWTCVETPMSYTVAMPSWTCVETRYVVYCSVAIMDVCGDPYLVYLVAPRNHLTYFESCQILDIAHEGFSESTTNMSPNFPGKSRAFVCLGSFAGVMYN